MELRVVGIAVVVALIAAATSCGGPDEYIGPDARVVVPIDAAVDAAVPTYVADVQPLLQQHCASCHAAGQGGPAAAYPFPASYAETQRPSALCPGEVVGRCVGLAVENQATEGAGCRTFVVTPFHREGWPCLTPAEQAVIAAWIAGGLPEQ